MSDADDIDQVNPDDVTLTDGMSGYNILVDGEYVGAIEGLPGKIEHIEVEMHWEGKGVARAAFDGFIALSRAHGVSEVTTNNAVNPAMEHILETEGFEEQSDDIGWVKEV